MEKKIVRNRKITIIKNKGIKKERSNFRGSIVK
jgi:hypothetical protein